MSLSLIYCKIRVNIKLTQGKILLVVHVNLMLKTILTLTVKDRVNFRLCLLKITTVDKDSRSFANIYRCHNILFIIVNSFQRLFRPIYTHDSRPLTLDSTDLSIAYIREDPECVEDESLSLFAYAPSKAKPYKCIYHRILKRLAIFDIVYFVLFYYVMT